MLDDFSENAYALHRRKAKKAQKVEHLKYQALSLLKTLLYVGAMWLIYNRGTELGVITEEGKYILLLVNLMFLLYK